MTWDGVRDERILDSVQLSYIAARERNQQARGDDINALMGHIDALHDIMRYCADLLHEERGRLQAANDAWSTVCACELLLYEHINDPETVEAAS